MAPKGKLPFRVHYNVVLTTALVSSGGTNTTLFDGNAALDEGLTVTRVFGNLYVRNNANAGTTCMQLLQHDLSISISASTCVLTTGGRPYYLPKNILWGHYTYSDNDTNTLYQYHLDVRCKRNLTWNQSITFNVTGDSLNTNVAGILVLCGLIG